MITVLNPNKKDKGLHLKNLKKGLMQIVQGGFKKGWFHKLVFSMQNIFLDLHTSQAKIG